MEVVFAGGVDGGGAGQRLADAGRRSGRRDVVEEAVVLVEHDEQDRAAPDLGVCGQGRDHLGGEVGALGGAGGTGVLGGRGGGDDVGDLRQGPGGDVAAQ